MSISYAPRTSFAQASSEAGTGYLDPNLVDGRPPVASRPNLHLTPDFGAALIASIAIAVGNHKAGEFRVLDFGGATGAQYDYVTAALEHLDVNLTWTVIETPLYVNYCRRAGRIDVKHFTSIDEAGDGPFDFVLFSGVLQYLDDWREPLRHAAVRGANHILISRTATGETEIPFLQTVNYPDHTVRYPGRIMRLADIEAMLKPTHDRFIGWDMSHHMMDLGIHAAPAMLWRRRNLT